MSGNRGTACAEQLWPILLSLAEGPTVSYTIKDLQRAVSRSRRTVQYGLKQLREAGLIGYADQVADGVWVRPIYPDGDPLDVFRQRVVKPFIEGAA